MGHHAEYVPIIVADPGHVPAGAVRIAFRSYFPVLLAVTEDDLAVLFQTIVGLIVAGVIPFRVCDRDRQDLARSSSEVNGVFVFSSLR